MQYHKIRRLCENLSFMLAFTSVYALIGILAAAGGFSVAVVFAAAGVFATDRSLLVWLLC
jgi:hypothetical protein